MKKAARRKRCGMKAISFMILFFLLLPPCLVTPATADLQDGDENGKTIVAKVNGKAIYEDQLKPYVESALKKYKKYGMKDPSPDLLKNVRKQELDRIIAQELLDQASKEIVVPDIGKKIDEKMKAMKESYPSEEQFEKHMKAKDQTISDLREFFRKKVYVDEYLSKKEVTNPEVPEAEIQRYYDNNKNNFQRKESIKVSHILIKVDKDTNPEEKEQKREKIEKIRRVILDGKDFGEAAKEYSECGSGPGGGDLGYIPKGYMPQEFDKVAFTLKKDEISEVVQTEFGYHIIKVFDRKPEGVIPYNEAKDFIAKYLKQNLAQKKMASHIEELREKAKIEIFIN